MYTMKIIRLSAIFGIAAFSAACEQIEEIVEARSLPKCESQQTIEDWNVVTSLHSDESGEYVIRKWETSKNYSTFFGLRVIYDSSKSPVPSLGIWHDYKSGDFVMWFSDRSVLRTTLDSKFALTTLSLRDIDVETLGSKSVRIEHTAQDGTWSVYETDGLPAALKQAQSEVETALARHSNKECAL